MAEQATSLTMAVAVLALLIAGLACVANWRQVKAGVSQIQLAHAGRRLEEIESLHRARLDVIESDCRRLRDESTQALAHAALCEQELARLGRLIQAQDHRRHS